MLTFHNSWWSKCELLNTVSCFHPLLPIHRRPPPASIQGICFSGSIHGSTDPEYVSEKFELGDFEISYRSDQPTTALFNFCTCTFSETTFPFPLSKAAVFVLPKSSDNTSSQSLAVVQADIFYIWRGEFPGVWMDSNNPCWNLCYLTKIF